MRETGDHNSSSCRREGISVRLRRLARMEEILCDYGPVCIKDIHGLIERNSVLKVSERTIQNDIDNFFSRVKYELLADYGFSITRRGGTLYYSVEPSKSIFRRNFSSVEIDLLDDMLSTLGKFKGVPGMESIAGIETIYRRKRRGTDSDCGLKRETPVVDLNIKCHENKELFATLFKAISEEQLVGIKYRTMYDPVGEECCRYETVRPYQIKRFDNRWVLIGAVDENGFIVNFSFDQILEVVNIVGKDGFSPERYNGKERSRVNRLYDNAIGPTMPRCLCIDREAYGEEDPERLETVYLYAYPGRANHLAAFPVIESQDELDSESEQFRTLMDSHPELPPDGRIFFFDCYPYRELKEAILSRMDSVVVLGPSSLREDIARRVSRLSEVYKL